MGHFEMMVRGSGRVLGVYEAHTPSSALKVALVPWLLAGRPVVQLRRVEPLDARLWHQRGAECHSADYLPAGHDGARLGELMEASIRPAIESMYEEELESLSAVDRPRAIELAADGYRASHELHGGTVFGRPSRVPPEPTGPCQQAA